MKRQDNPQLPMIPTEPELAPLNEKDRSILAEFYEMNKNKQWFDGALIIKNHASHMGPTLEIYCNYNPVLEMRDIIQFTSKYSLSTEMVNRSNQG